MKETTQLLLQKVECEDAILCLMKDNRGNGYLFVRGVLERLIGKIDARLESEKTTAVLPKDKGEERD